jgi:tetratricopeptide (TPR) repeat protein
MEGHDYLNSFNLGKSMILKNLAPSKNYVISSEETLIEATPKIKIFENDYLEETKEDYFTYLSNNSPLKLTFKLFDKTVTNYFHSFNYFSSEHEEYFSILGNKLPLLVNFNVQTVTKNLPIQPKKLNNEIASIALFQIVKNKLTDYYENMAQYYTLQGDVSYESGNYNECLLYYLKSLNLNMLDLKYPNKELAISYNNCASAYLKLKDYQNSLEFYQKALKIFEDIYGKEHQIIASVWNSMGLIFENISDYKNSLTCYMTSLKIKKKVYGGKSPSTGLAYYNVGKAYDNINTYETATHFYHKAIIIFKDQEPSIEYATALNSLGLINDKMNKFKSSRII